MKRSTFLCQTSEQSPSEAETTSHRLLLQGDFIDQVASGIYSLLPLGWRVYQKVENIIREEMNALGAQELFLPTLQPKKLWRRSGRWDNMEPPLFKITDQHERELALGSTHEEVITDLVSRRVSSYRHLPLALYQIQNKFRNEMRATGGLLRTREFMMKDLYSFHQSQKSLNEFYKQVQKAYENIFRRMGLEIVWVEASSGSIGGRLSHEAMVLCEQGEDKILFCPHGDFATNIEKSQRQKCPHCGTALQEKRSIEVGHVFQLGDQYSRKLKATYTNQEGEEKYLLMGCYGLGLQRIMAAIVEKWHDEHGIIWPLSVAPFEVALIGVEQEEVIQQTTEAIYSQLLDDNVEVLWDDRSQKSTGEKFADADLLGIPYRLVVSQKTLQKEQLEIKMRKSGEVKLIPKGEIINYLDDEFSKS